jgi:hypothetical protein
MGNKKNIDRFFQGQFKDFEANPSKSVWENISNELEKEDRSHKRVLPLWFKLSGIAASLLFLIAIGVSQFSSEKAVNEVVVEGENIIDKNKLATELPVVNNSANSGSTTSQSEVKTQSSIKELNDKIAFQENKFTGVNNTENRFSSSKSSADSNDLIYEDEKKYKKDIINNDQTVVHSSLAKKVNSESKYKEQNTVNSLNKFAVNSGENSNSNANKINGKIINDVNIFSEDDLSPEDLKNESIVENKSDFSKSNSEINNDTAFYGTAKNTQYKALIKDPIYDIAIDDASKLLNNESKLNDKKSIDANRNLVQSNSKVRSYVDTVEGKTLDGQANDVSTTDKNIALTLTTNAPSTIIQKNISDKEILAKTNSKGPLSDLDQNSHTEESMAIKATIVKKENLAVDDTCVDEDVVEEELPIEETIEEAIAEQELKKDEESDEEINIYKKWEIAPNIAPVYYNSLSSGSPIDDDFEANKKKGQFTTSYGIGVGYALNKRLSVRTGVNRLEVGYDTQDVAIYLSPETTSEHQYKNINFSSAGSGMSIAGSGTYSSTQIPSSFSSLYDSSLNQRFGYLEVPLELSYKLSDKKLRVDVIAGISTFFLNKNEIYSENKTTTIYIGEANNLNKMSYSTNLGVGLEYKLSKTLSFNFDPMFKYQLNAFSNDAGNFKPYILGVYSGLSYRF